MNIFNRSNRLPKELQSIIESKDFQNSGETNIKKVELWPDFVVTFSILSNSGGGDWQVTIKGCKEYSIGSSVWPYSEFHVYDEHPLLAKYNADEYYLYISSEPVETGKLIADIYMAHIDLTGDNVTIERYLGGSLFDACTSYRGLFAAGPKSILSKYKKVLDKHKVGNNMLLDKQRPELNTAPCRLLVLNKGYFIGTDFNFKELQ